MNRKTLFVFVLIFLGILMTGCIQCNILTPESSQRIIEPDIKSFVDSFNFPKLRGIDILLEIPTENVQIFKISYGELHDCPAGCFNSIAIGIKHKNKIGWISVNNYDNEFDANNIQMYDFDSDDSYLFSEEFFNKLKSKDSWVYHYAFLPLLAKDPDAPNKTLLKIAEDLSSYIQPSLASSLLENPKVQHNKQILRIIADLPVFSGDPYKEVKIKAQSLLASFE